MEQQAERQQRKPGRWYAIITLIGVVLSGIFIAGLPASAIVKAEEQGTPGTEPAQALIPSTEPEEVITGFSPTGLVDNGDHLFVASQGYGIESCQLDPTQKTPVLRRMNYDGSGVEVLIERCVFFQKGMLADADFVYFRDGDNDLKKIAVNGGSPTTLATDTCCGGLAMDETYIYWGQWGDAGESNSIWRIAKNNGEPEFIASFSDPNNYNIYGLAVDDTDIYWAGGNIGGGIVRKLAKAGGTPQTLADISEGIDNARGIALDANYVYWTELGTGRVRRIAKSGGSVKDYLDPQEYYQAGSVAVNGAHIYWADTTGGYDGRIRRVDKSGGQIDDLVLGALGPDTVLLTDSHIYYGKSGGVYRLPLDAAGVAVDLAIDYLEVTQGIQNLANEVPLVREKPAFVRVYPRLAETHGDLHGLNVTAQLRGFRNGSELPDSPLFPVNATVFLKTQEADRMELNQTFNFWLPESWRSGTVTFQAELNPDGAVNDSIQPTMSTVWSRPSTTRNPSASRWCGSAPIRRRPQPPIPALSTSSTGCGRPTRCRRSISTSAARSRKPSSAWRGDSFLTPAAAPTKCPTTTVRCWPGWAGTICGIRTTSGRNVARHISMAWFTPAR